ncbi:4-aminobutyrate aminotransferase [Aneurinibacillus migulanus]|uniref:(S)-3-amino-2-methylpropionate transaminase n=1 Tax=Aneurinibacillus migulanus TaxID=47500 RepID=A0A0D1V1N4_ANEMI|nr:4-aminobutyrate--2-oxoglutarate transaminase [Aneurinibacillus migulanus]KIV53264.1 4-aminobutyrate aminotransferase [Aneurinibacillus migulanus]KIV57829.1 4-aminobutyrate aminotransferase [Aneurinibacillus migulanus]KON97415.1 4-aminobutyrate aminotransferase [Aneurinibacillus migulanus]KPD07322.1 4-aminobutyrate aminotransferase [Aneurinibacillus migulanus]MCP1356413.1 4-aminobutyrate--2-oxoglutarate transaminase [Aneurinibacillus migulanus]
MIPGVHSSTLHKRRQEAVPVGPYNITPLYIESAAGTIIKDVDGNTFLDFAGGIGMQNVGHCHPKVVKAIQEQAEASIHSCFHVMPYESYITLAEKLNERTPGNWKKKTMFLNSGAEAIENAIKIARKATGRSIVLSFERAFHGRTLMTMSLTSKVNPYKLGFGPFAPDTYKMPYPYYYRAPYNMVPEEVDLEILHYFEQFFLTEVSPYDVAAIILEPVQGEGGFVVPSANFVQGIRSLCNEYGIMMIVDEVQTGFGRTGEWFAIEHFDVVPDMITMSKSIAAGIPLSAVTGRADIMDAPEIGQLGGTFAGSPIACAAGLAVFEIMEEEQIVERARIIGARMMTHFHHLQEKYDIIGDVRGIGAMVAMELVKDRSTKEPAKEVTAQLVTQCWKNGLLALSAGIYGNVIRFLPPLLTTDEQLDEGLQILDNSFAKIVR